MSYDVHFDQYIDIGGVPLSTPAWEVLNIHVLMSGPGVRGENRVIPGAAGRRPLRHRPDERTVTLQLAVFGHVDPAGDPITDPQEGVWTNWLALRDQFTALLTTAGDSTVTATLNYAGGTLSGPVQVLAYELGEPYSTTDLSAILDLNLVTGMLT